jgi:hypothetical protein
MLLLPAESVKVLMNKLLVGETFDDYELRGCVIQSFARFDIEGISSAGAEASGGTVPVKAVYCKWRRLRPYVYGIIKGSEKPRFFKLVFGCPPDLLDKRFEKADALFVNIVLDKDAAHITTGISTKVWSLDKSAEELWDNYIMDFLRQNHIYFEQ